LIKEPEVEEVVREQNPYEGITFFSDALPESKFAVTVSKRTIGYFSSLQAAILARDLHITNRAAQSTTDNASPAKREAIKETTLTGYGTQ